MKIVFLAAYLLAVSFSNQFDAVRGHGFMYEPITRNYYAHTDGLDWGHQAGLPEKEYCQHCLNRLNTKINGVCGVSEGGADYDTWLDSLGAPMPWKSQHIYTAGDTIVVKSHLASVCIYFV